jgi:iron complex outermembrane recepter protein
LLVVAYFAKTTEKFARGGAIKQPSIGCVGLRITGVFLLSASITFGQEVSPRPSPADRSGVTIEEVIVTGSNIPTSEEVGPNPVDTYRKEDITRLGARTMTEFLQKLPEVSGAALSENGGNSHDGRVEINLRGILAKETLVLQDGRRLASVAFGSNISDDTVDLNTIPLGLIDHVDILKDGASAIYGADAVAGVFNVWLIHKFRGLELYASYGNTNLGFANDAGEERAYLLAGTGDDKTDIIFYAESYNRAAIFSRDADISSDADHVNWGGFDMRSDSFAGRVNGYVFDPALAGGSRTPTPHSQINPNSVPADPITGEFPAIVGQYRLRASLPREQQAFNFADFTPAIAAADRQYFYGSLDRKICGQYVEFFADFKYARTFWDGALAPVPFSSDVFTDATHPLGISGNEVSVPIQNPFNPFTAADYTSPGGRNPNFPPNLSRPAPPGTQFTTGVSYRALEAGLRRDKITTDNYVFTGGLKGNLGEFGEYLKTWNWEAGFRYNEDSRVERFGPVADVIALHDALLDTNPATAFNPFGLNQNTKTAMERVFVRTTRFGAASLTLEDAKLYGDLFSLPGGPVSFAIGGEHRTEHRSDRPDQLTAGFGTIGDVSFSSTKASRDVWSIYWEARIPVTSPAWNLPGLYSLELDYQERFEYFSDFGGTERPKFLMRWQPIDSAFTIRATYSEAYHAPTLTDLFAAPVGDFAFFGPGELTDPRSPPPPNNTGGDLGIVRSLHGGNSNLQPETAYEWTYGAIVTPGKWWSPLQGLTLQADFYHIDLRGVTVELDPQFLINHEDEFPGFVVRAPPSPAEPFGPIVLLELAQANLGRLVQEGWDYELAYAFESSRLGHGDWGTLNLTLNGTYIDRVELQAVPGGPEKSVVGKLGGGFLGPLAGGSFTHNRWYASLFYDGPAGSRLAGLDTGFTVHYIGQYWDVSAAQLGFPRNAFSNRKVREWTTLDWILNYTFNFPAPAGQNQVPGYAKDGIKNGKDKNAVPVSTAEYSSCGWRAWLNNTTITLGVNNVFDLAPPFIAVDLENGFDQSTANIKGRTWYVALKKRF